MYYVYLLECNDGSIYTGIATDVVRRFKEHATGKGSRYTRARGVKRILYTETHTSRSSASKREAEIKKWSKEKKTALSKERASLHL